ncbi:proliferation-associated 2G4,b [Capsaspora owczarzaki ATCC 30864]|uniref:Proliferation-associated 2G4,b n=1 Tax=Capsaspora owczarzaki (strain ATCC 30864) TaxID=595528 RepID=A0A0D2UE77_CAPO3|nr:proliferation-associated 2G4,b [Capsaspora owczarzaki ATCC 30864]KJE93426.1 proliferation-associated 2G4,b [Capsaspora owczarzaki ATCC 30864]|eukprot:XP_004348044.1 proliferation-associated 2G4,b [Capsaspora owczarzaki ATCC 30864]
MSTAAQIEEEEGDFTLDNPDTVTKYRTAGDIANRVIKKVLAAAVPGATVLALCKLGDGEINEEVAKIYKANKKVKKGIAFPTCVSLNSTVCHQSPLSSDAAITLQAGDVAKVDLGVHVDGLIAVVAHTIVVGATKEAPVTGRKADVLLAAYNASEAAVRLVQAGSTNHKVTETVQQVAQQFKCNTVEGMLSHQLERNIIDGKKTIILNPNEAQRKEHKELTFEIGEVYGVDVIVSTAEGKSRTLDTRTTVYKKTDAVYLLKMQASRTFLSQAKEKYGNFPFSIRSFDDENKAKIGVLECTKHNVMTPFSVLYDRDDTASVAQFKFTVLLTKNGPIRITSVPFEAELFKSEHSVVDAELKALLASSAKGKSKAKKADAAAPEAASSSSAPAPAAAQ